MRNQTSTKPSRWLTFQTASPYVGVSIRTLQNWEKAGHLRVANVAPMGTRGRRLIDREHLDRFIESYVGAPPSRIAMNEGRIAQ
jgi:excisionase family DNA binding protein